jgi:hypothetical protein
MQENQPKYEFFSCHLPVVAGSFAITFCKKRKSTHTILKTDLISTDRPRRLIRKKHNNKSDLSANGATAPTIT